MDPAYARGVRLRAGVRQAEVASLLGVLPSTVSRWESGQRRPSLELVSRYRELLERLAREAA